MIKSKNWLLYLALFVVACLLVTLKVCSFKPRWSQDIISEKSILRTIPSELINGVVIADGFVFKEKGGTSCKVKKGDYVSIKGKGNTRHAGRESMYWVSSFCKEAFNEKGWILKKIIRKISREELVQQIKKAFPPVDRKATLVNIGEDVYALPNMGKSWQPLSYIHQGDLSIYSYGGRSGKKAIISVLRRTQNNKWYFVRSSRSDRDIWGWLPAKKLKIIPTEEDIEQEKEREAEKNRTSREIKAKQLKADRAAKKKRDKEAKRRKNREEQAKQLRANKAAKEVEKRKIRLRSSEEILMEKQNSQYFVVKIVVHIILIGYLVFSFSNLNYVRKTHQKLDVLWMYPIGQYVILFSGAAAFMALLVFWFPGYPKKYRELYLFLVLSMPFVLLLPGVIWELYYRVKILVAPLFTSFEENMDDFADFKKTTAEHRYDSARYKAAADAQKARKEYYEERTKASGSKEKGNN